MRLYEITRRGFLKGAGAAAGLAATNAMAAPFTHGEYRDQLTGKSEGKYHSVVSNDGKSRLTFDDNGLYFRGPYHLDISPSGEPARMLLDGKVVNVYLIQVQRGVYNLCRIYTPDGSIAKRVFKSSGLLKLEVPVYSKNNEVISFNIEPDDITKKEPEYKEPKKQEPKKEPEGPKVDYKKQASDMYNARCTARIKPNIIYNGTPPGKITVKITASASGEITGSNIVNSSGDKTYDDAVLKAISRTGVLPRDTEGDVPSVITVEF